MPRLNSRGDWCTGIAGAGAYIGTVDAAGRLVPWHSWPAGTAGGHAWVDDETVITQRYDGVGGVEQPRVVAWSTRTRQESLIRNHGASAAAGGGGVWAVFFRNGVTTSTGLALPEAGLGPVGPDGAVAIKTRYHSYGPWMVHERDGSAWQLTAGDAHTIQLLGQGRGCWIEDGQPRAVGVPVPQPITRPFWWLRMVETPEGWWCLYQAEDGRLLLHPATDTVGYEVAPVGSLTYAPDVVRLPTGKLRVIWAVSQGEPEWDLRVRDLDLSAPRVRLVPITPPDDNEPPNNDPPVEEPPVTGRRLTDAERATVQAFADRFGLPALNGDAARAWTRRLCEQMKFSHGEQWSHKRADPGRPPSTDVIAAHNGGRFWGWDVILNQGLAHQSLKLDGEAEDITGQTPIEVDAVDYLAGEKPPEKPPEQPPLDVVEVLKQLVVLQADVRSRLDFLTRHVQTLLERPQGEWGPAVEELKRFHQYEERPQIIAAFNAAAKTIKPKLFGMAPVDDADRA